jgi:NitT/TauT family transport system permease protein
MRAGSLLLNASPGRGAALLLPWVLFAAGIAIYVYAARERHVANPDERVTPTITQMVQGMAGAALRPAGDEEEQTPRGTRSERFFGSMLWKDTTATARRFVYAMLLLVPAVLLGLHIGLFPYAGLTLERFVLFFDKIVALSLLPVLFIVFGIDELSKVMLIVIGVAPTVALDTANLARAVPREHIVKAFTLGASDFDIAYRVVFRQILPRVLDGIRLNLKAVTLFLFAGEMIASTDGLAYRIALLRRHMGMDVIVPYVLWVALLLFLVDLAMRRANRFLHPWFQAA